MYLLLSKDGQPFKGQAHHRLTIPGLCSGELSLDGCTVKSKTTRSTTTTTSTTTMTTTTTTLSPIEAERERLFQLFMRQRQILQQIRSTTTTATTTTMSETSTTLSPREMGREKLLQFLQQLQSTTTPSTTTSMSKPTTTLSPIEAERERLFQLFMRQRQILQQTTTTTSTTTTTTTTRTPDRNPPRLRFHDQPAAAAITVTPASPVHPAAPFNTLLPPPENLDEQFNRIIESSRLQPVTPASPVFHTSPFPELLPPNPLPGIQEIDYDGWIPIPSTNKEVEQLNKPLVVPDFNNPKFYVPSDRLEAPPLKHPFPSDRLVPPRSQQPMHTPDGPRPIRPRPRRPTPKQRLMNRLSNIGVTIRDGIREIPNRIVSTFTRRPRINRSTVSPSPFTDMVKIKSTLKLANGMDKYRSAKGHKVLGLKSGTLISQASETKAGVNVFVATILVIYAQFTLSRNLF